MGALLAQNKSAEAEALFRESLTVFREMFGDHHPETLTCINNLGMALKDSRPAEAETLFRQALAGRREVLGTSHPDVEESASNLGRLLMDQDRLAEALLVCSEALGSRQGRE